MATIEPLTRSEMESKVLHVPGPVALDFYQASCAPCRALSPPPSSAPYTQAANRPPFAPSKER
jgi:hypothetical protein